MNARRYGIVCLALALVAVAACRRAEGPEPIAFDRASCAHCRMLISDPAFAAQLQTEDGEVFDFDDPGCLMRFREEHASRVRAVWFHHLREDRWLREAVAGFVPIQPTPMGYGFGAVDASEPGALTPAQAAEQVRVRAAAQREKTHVAR